MSLDNRFDAVDRRFLALLECPRDVFAAKLDQSAQAIVANRREMRGGARGHAARDRPLIENNDGMTGLAQLIGCGQARDARANDDSVAGEVLRQRRRISLDWRPHP